MDVIDTIIVIDIVLDQNCCTGGSMLWTIAVVLIILWALGMISSYTMGGFIHFLLVVAVVLVLVRVIQGRRPM